MHGPYDSRALRELIEHYRVELVAYPSAGPETFSFTLSEAWAAGRPAIVPPIGALADRVAETGAGWVLSDEEWRSEERMLDRIAAVLDRLAARRASPRRHACARTALQPTLEAMTAATIASIEPRSGRQERRARRGGLSPRRAALPRCATRRGGRRSRPARRCRRRTMPFRALAAAAARDPLAHVARAALSHPPHADGPRAVPPGARVAARRAQGAAAAVSAPDDGAWLARGQAHQRAGRTVDALLCYREALAGQPLCDPGPFSSGRSAA